MILELISLLWLWMGVNTMPSMTMKIALGIMSLCLLLIWGLTAYKIVPLHTQIEENGDTQDIHRLIYLNAYRSVLWGIKNLGMGIVLYQVYINASL
jgi:hypothetical protein